MSLDTKPFIAKEAQLILIETDRIRVINHLYILLNNAHTTLRKRQIIKLLGKVDPNNQKAISTLDSLLQDIDLDIFERIQIAEELGQIDVGNLKAVSTLIDMLYINQDYAWWSANGRGEVGDGSRAEFGFSIIFAVAALEEISDGSEEIVNALIEVLKKNRIPDVRNRVILSLNKFNSNFAHFILNRAFEQAKQEQDYLKVSELLGKVDTGSWKVIGAFLELLDSEDEDIRIDALRNLGDIGQNMPEAICSYKAVSKIVALLEDDKWYYSRYEITACLGKIGISQPFIHNILTKLLEEDEDEQTQLQAAIAIKKFENNNLKATNFLLNFICSYQHDKYKNKYIPGEVQDAVNSLRLTDQITHLYKIVSVLKKYVIYQKSEIDPEFYDICIDIIRHCAKKMTFVDFCKVWEEEEVVY